MRSHYLAVAAPLLALAVAQDTSHSSHESHAHDEASHQSHEGERFEAAAVYDVEAGSGSFAVIPAAGSFEEETFAFMIVPCASADLGGLEEAEEEAEAVWDAYISGAKPTVLASGEEAIPDAAVVYQIALQDPLVLVPIDVAVAGAYAIFLEHGTGEVTTALASPSGVFLVAAVEEEAAGLEEGEEDEHEYEDGTATATGLQWANALGASLVVSACSFAGLLVVTNKQVAYNIGLSHAFIFASGALLTVSLLHLIPEAMEGFKSNNEDRLHDLALYAGLSVLGGMSFGILIHGLMATGHPSHGQTRLLQHAAGGIVGADVLALNDSGHLMPRSLRKVKSATISAPEVPRPPSYGLSRVMGLDVTQPSTPAETTPGNLKELITASEGRSMLDVKDLQPVCWNVIAGDLVHNFADGVTIGAAFLGCSTAIGWIVTASAVLHEVPHELADFMALLNGGMSVKQAFAYNFLSALSAVLGTTIILALGGTLTTETIAIVLLIGAGSLIVIALSELLPEALGVSETTIKRGRKAIMWSQARKLGSFLLGGVLIGIPLIFDRQCAYCGEHH